MEFNESLVKGRVTWSLIKFAIPVMFANILRIIYTSTDFYVLGKFGTTADMAAMTTTVQIMSLVTLGMSGLTMAIMVILGKHYGAKNKRDLAGAFGSGVVFFLIAAVVLTVPFLLLNHWLVDIMKTPPEAVEAARGYLLICSSGIIFILGFNVLGFIFRGLGNSKLVFVFTAISCTINIIIDLVFIGALKMGAIGAAYATVISQGISLILAALYIRRSGLGFPITRADFMLRTEHIKPLLKIGVPISLQELLVTISFMKITEVANQISVHASASVGIVEQLMGMFTLPVLAMSTAVGAMSAQNIGAGKRARAEKCVWSGIIVSLSITLPICAYCVFLGGTGASPIALFQNDPEVIRNGGLYIKSYVFDVAGLAFIFLFNAYFNSCGYSVFTMIHSVAVTILVRVPVVLIMSRLEGASLFHIGLGAPAATLVSLIACLVFFFWLKHKNANTDRLEAQYGT